MPLIRREVVNEGGQKDVGLFDCSFFPGVKDEYSTAIRLASTSGETS